MGLRRHRLCRLRPNPAFAITVCIGIVLIIANYLRSKSSSDDDAIHNLFRDHVKMSSIREWQASSQGKNRKRIRFDDEDEQPFQICQTPRLSLQNDANAFAFFELPRLNCTVDSLFYTKLGALYLNRTVLEGRSLDRCEYKAIVWESDSYYSYSEPLIRKEPPFEMKVKHDFFKIECYLKKDNKSDSNDQPLVESRQNNRRILQVGISKNGRTKYAPDNENEHRNEQYVHTGKANMHDFQHNVQNVHQDTQFKQDVNHNMQVTDNQVQMGNMQAKHQDISGVKKDKMSQFGSSAYHNVQRIDLATGSQNVNSKTGQQMNLMDSSMGNKFTVQNTSTLNLREGSVGNQMSSQNQSTHQHTVISINNSREQKNNRTTAKTDSEKIQADDKPENEAKTQASANKGVNGEGDDKKTDDEHVALYEDHTPNPNYDYNSDEGDYHYVAPDVPDFEQFVAQVVRRDEVVKRIKDITPHKYSTQMNVLMFAMDSMSHLAYQRKMPKTYQYVKNKLGAIILNSYNIVGDATTAAIIPMLTGKNIEELPEVRKNQPGSTYVDAYPLIWNRFEQNGYATLLAEDEPTLSTFNLRFNGFEEIPTDHYMRHFWLASHASNLYDISPRFCLGRTARHQFLLKYMKQFNLVYKDVPKFSFNMMTEYTHSHNNPAQYVDEDLVKTLESLRRNKVFDNTLVIIFGDHGARYSQVRGTIQGKMEERLPMMSFAFPEWFKKKYPKLIRNLETNANRLTTPFDVYETLRDVLDMRRSDVPVTFKERGISLLKEVPINRTCASAGIDMHWCTCMHWRPVDGFEAETKIAAGHIVDAINKVTEKHRLMCRKLSLKRIEDAKMVFPNEKVLTFMKTIDGDQRIANFSRDVDIDLMYYQLIVETLPNNGLYEATVSYHVETKTYKVSPEISRINVYGNQANCVVEKLPDLRKFCHCKQNRDEG